MTQSRRDRERQARKDNIITAAEKLFFEKGFEATSMDEVAKASEFTKRTVYMYFLNKEDLFYAVVLKGVEQLLIAITKASNKGDTGFSKFRLIKQAAYRFSKEHPDMYRLMIYAQYVKAGKSDSPHYQQILVYNRQLFGEFERITQQGIADGTISKEITHPLGTLSLFLIATGFIERLVEAGDMFASRFGISTETLAQHCMDLTDKIMKPL